MGFYSCEIADNQDLLLPTLEEKLKEVMNMPRDFSPGNLKSIVVYGGDSEKIQNTREIYYPFVGNISFHVLRNQDQDTVSVSLNYFEGEILKISHLFNYEIGKFVWWSTREYEYISENRIDNIFQTTENMEKRLLAQYVYNSENLLSQIVYGTELAVFEYDSVGRISREWKTSLDQKDSKIDYLVYRYVNGLLVGKESGIRGIISEDRKDAFQYFHDAQERIIMQKEFDPYFGFQQKSWSEFFYHTSRSN
jgi:hypothetical protein